MINQNTSAWIEKGMGDGIDLSYLQQDKKMIYDKLETWNIPHPTVYEIRSDEINSSCADLFFTVMDIFAG